MVKAWFFRTLGNIVYDFNRGLNRLYMAIYRLAIWAYAIAWEAEEKAKGRIPK